MCSSAVIPGKDVYNLHFEVEKVFNSSLWAWCAGAIASSWARPTLLVFSYSHGFHQNSKLLVLASKLLVLASKLQDT